MKAVKGSVRVSGWLMSFLLIGCGLAGTGVQAEDRPAPVRSKDAARKATPVKVAPAKAAPVAVETAAPVAPVVDGLQGRDVYQILLGEIALKRGEAGIAAEAYADVARRTGDDALFGRAVQVAVAAQHYDTALQVSQKWVQASPDSAAARHALVNVLAGLGRGAEMAPHIERLLALDAEARPRNLLHLPRLFAGVDPDLALATLLALVEPYQDLAEAQFALASVARAAGQKEQALAAIREAYRLRPGWPAAGFLEAQLQDSAAESIAVWTRVLKDNKDSEPAYLQRARLYVAEKKYNEARADFEAALALNPDSIDTLYALAILTLQLDDRAAAEKHFRQLEGREFAGKGLVDYQLGLLAQDRGDLDAAQRFFGEVGPGEHYVAARAQLALMLSRQGKLEEARKLLAETEATTVSDRSRLAIADSHVLREAKQLEAAFAVLEAALVAAPNEPDLLYDKAMLADQLKKTEVVETTLTRLIELRPNHPHAYNALGYSWAERNIRLEEARQLIRRALELAPDDPFILDSMGWVMFRLGQPKVALTHLEDAYRQRPDPEIAAHIGEVLWSLGRRDEARKLWAEARLRHPDNEVLGAVIEKFQP